MKPAAGSTIASRVYELIKERIITLEYPPGTLLTERVLAETLDVSRTPVREALLRLTQTEWIQWQNHRSAIVKEVTLKDVEDIFEMRKMIEPYAIRYIFEKETSRLLAGTLDLFQNQMTTQIRNQKEFITVDMLFHSAIIDHVGNHRLIEIWKNIAESIMRLGLLAVFQKQGRSERVLNEHSCLIDSLWKKDLEATLEAMKVHHRNTYEVLAERWIKETVSPTTETEE